MLQTTQLMDFDLHLRLIFRRMLMKFFCRVESKARLRHKKGQSVEVRTKTVVSHHRPTERQAEAGGRSRSHGPVGWLSKIYMLELSHFRKSGKLCAKLFFAENLVRNFTLKKLTIWYPQICNFLTEK